MISKLSILEEEAGESVLRLDLISEHGVVKPAALAALGREAGEPTAIMVASRRTLRGDRDSRLENRKS